PRRRWRSRNGARLAPVSHGSYRLMTLAWAKAAINQVSGTGTGHDRAEGPFPGVLLLYCRPASVRWAEIARPTQKEARHDTPDRAGRHRPRRRPGRDTRPGPPGGRRARPAGRGRPHPAGPRARAVRAGQADRPALPGPEAA